MLDLPRPGAVPARGGHHVPLAAPFLTAPDPGGKN